MEMDGFVTAVLNMHVWLTVLLVVKIVHQNDNAIEHSNMPTIFRVSITRADASMFKGVE
jgi:hypothetical protein